MASTIVNGSAETDVDKYSTGWACSDHGMFPNQGDKTCPTCGQERLNIRDPLAIDIFRFAIERRKNIRLGIAAFATMLPGLFGGMWLLVKMNVPNEIGMIGGLIAYVIWLVQGLIVYKFLFWIQKPPLKELERALPAKKHISYKQLLTRTPVILALAIIVTFVFFRHRDLIAWFGMVPREIMAGNTLHTLLANALVHVDGNHLLLNTVALLAFGLPVDYRVGRGYSLAVFWISCLCGNVLYAFFNPGSAIPCVGASAGVYGFFGAQLALMPTMKSILSGPYGMSMVTPIYIKAPVVMVLFTVLDALSQNHVAWLGHIGGFGAGLVVGLLLRKTKESRLFIEYRNRREHTMRELDY